MSAGPTAKLEVLIAHDEGAERLAEVTAAVVGLPHQVIDRTIGLKRRRTTRRWRLVQTSPIVIVAQDSGPQALEAIDAHR